MNMFTKHGLAVFSVILASIAVYLPAVDNTFISDDFGIFPILDALDENPSYIFDATSEFFRVMSYVYFGLCFWMFGAVPEPFYWMGIALHVLISILVYCLALRITGRWMAAWPAALFFAAYERHQEAVMWISAANELVLTLWCLVFLIVWEYAVIPGRSRSIPAAAAFVVLALALFSKEAAVVLGPMAVLGLIVHGYSRREVLEKSVPIAAMLTAFVVLWLSQADRNFFVADGHYAFGSQAVFVYGRALLRLIAPLIPFWAAVCLLRHRKQEARWTSGLLFFSALLLLSIIPYSFLTYQDHLPSRHTYLPSVGLAGLVGIFFATVQERLSSHRLRQAWVSFLFVLVVGNGVYIWLKKEQQYRERAAPTRELIEILNRFEPRQERSRPLYVCGFPLGQPWWFGDAVSRFTPFERDDVILMDGCVSSGTETLLAWDPSVSEYSINLPQASQQPIAVDAAVERQR